MPSDLLAGFQAGMQLGAPLVEAKLQKLAFKRQSKLAKKERQSRERIARKGIESNEKLARNSLKQRKTEHTDNTQVARDRLMHQKLADDARISLGYRQVDVQDRANADLKEHRAAQMNLANAQLALSENQFGLESDKFEAARKRQEFMDLAPAEKLNFYMDDMSNRSQAQIEELQALKADPNASPQEITRLENSLKNRGVIVASFQRAFDAAVESGSLEAQMQVINQFMGQNIPRSYTLGSNPITGEMYKIERTSGKTEKVSSLLDSPRSSVRRVGTNRPGYMIDPRTNEVTPEGGNTQFDYLMGQWEKTKDRKWPPAKAGQLK